MPDELKRGISVVLPAHGSCEFLLEAIRSLYDSSRQPDEVILVDDGISPSTLEGVVEEYPGIRIVLNRGRGLVDALNTGLAAAAFDLVARIDADDLATEIRFEIQEDFMRSNTHVALCGTQVRYISGKGELLGSSEYIAGDITEETRKGERCLVAHPSVIYRTAVARSVGGYRKILTIGGVNLAEDYDLWIRISRVGNVVNLNQMLTYYRQHLGQLSMIHFNLHEIASYFIRSVAQHEEASGKLVANKIINNFEDAIETTEFVKNTLGFRLGWKYRIEILNHYKKMHPLLRRILVRIL